MLHGIAPAGFRFPPTFVEMVRGPLPDIIPYDWLMVDGDVLEVIVDTLRRLYPNRSLVPFAGDTRNDDLFCFDGHDTTGEPAVLLIHAFASPGWEYRGEWRSFESWLEEAARQRREWEG